MSNRGFASGRVELLLEAFGRDFDGVCLQPGHGCVFRSTPTTN